MTEIFVAVNNHCFPKKESISFQEHVINIEETLESEPNILERPMLQSKTGTEYKKMLE